MSLAEAAPIGSTAWYDALRNRSTPTLHRVRMEAYGPGGFVGQDSFMRAGQILSLARQARVCAEGTVLDICCGSGGPALYVAHHTGCRIIGVDLSSAGLLQARDGQSRHEVGFVLAEATKLPFAGEFDAVLLLETMLAIEDKAALLSEVARLLPPGRRFGLTLEEGRPLSEQERWHIPAGDRVWIVPAAHFGELSHSTGFRVAWIEDQSRTHAEVATRLAAGLSTYRDPIADEVGAHVCQDLIAAHEHWSDWLQSGRVRKLAVVLERVE